MTLEPSRTAATASLAAALTSRLFYGLALDAPEAGNAAWLAAPLGLSLALPAVWLICRIKGAARRWLSGLLCLAMAMDAAAGIEWTAYSESCLAFDHVPPLLMTLPLLLALARCIWLGADALGGAARIWARLFLLLILVVIVYQLPYYRPGWLRPWLGYGKSAVFRTALRAAGWIALLSGGAATACREDMPFRSLLRPVLLAAAVAAALVALRQMMAPVPTRAVSRFMAVDALLTNGRAPLYLQLPMIVAWFAGMLHLLAFEGVAACALLHGAFPGTRDSLCAILGLGGVAALTLLRVPGTDAARLALPYLYHLLAGAALILWLWKGWKSKCARSA